MSEAAAAPAPAAAPAAAPPTSAPANDGGPNMKDAHIGNAKGGSSGKYKYEHPDHRVRERTKREERALKHFMDTGEELDPDNLPPEEPAKPAKAKPKADKAEAKPETKPAEKAPEKPDSKPVAAKSPPPPTPPPQPATERPPEPAAHAEQLQKARLLREHSEAVATAERTKREVAAEKQAHEATKAENAKMKEQLERWKKDPHRAIVELGSSLEDVSKGIVEGRYEARPNSAPKADPELISRLEAAESFMKEMKEREAQAAARAQREAHITQMRGIMEQHAESFPFAASYEPAAGIIVDRVVGQGQTDVSEALRDYDAAIRGLITPIVGNSRALSILLASKPELADTLRAALDAHQANPSASNEDGGSTSVASTAPRSLGAIPEGPSAMPPRGTPEYDAWEIQELNRLMREG